MKRTQRIRNSNIRFQGSNGNYKLSINGLETFYKRIIKIRITY